MHSRGLSMEPKLPPHWSSEWNFGLIALVVLGLLSIAALLIMPEIFVLEP